MDKVLACITTRDGNPPLKVVAMVEDACRELAKAGIPAAVSVPQDRYSVACCRNRAVNDAIRGGFTHIFFCDDDVYIEPDTLVKLWGMQKDVAGGVYPSIKTMYPGDLKLLHTYVVAKYEGQWLRKFFKGIRRVDAVGAGSLMIRTSVFDKVGFPWFRWPEVILPDGRHERVSDDLDFCNRCAMAGVEVWAHGDVRPGHVKPVDIRNFVGEEE